MISVGSLYHLIPKLWNHKQMYSIGLINVHFWLATIGTVIYIAAMWVNGLPQGLMWRAAGREAVNPLLIPPSVAARDWSGAVDRPAAGGSNQAGVER